MMFSFHKTLNGVKCDVDITDDLCLIYGDSATGKTFISNVINSAYKSEGKRCLYVTGEDDIDKLVSDINIYTDSRSVIILDDADMCFCKEVLEALGNSKGIKIIIFKTTLEYDRIKCDSLGYYDVECKPNQIKLVRSRRCEI